MTWILIAYLLVLIYLALHREKLVKGGSLRLAWMWFVAIPISHFVFALFKAGNIGTPRDLALIEIWSDGIEWLLLGGSLFFLTGALFQDRSGNVP
jgi:hypothetical protein